MRTLYVTDLDGTLLTPEQGVSEYTKEVLSRAKKAGIAVTYATARSMNSASKVTDYHEFEYPAAVYNGAFAVRNVQGKREYSISNTFTEEETTMWKEFWQVHNLNPLCYSIQNGEEKVSWLRNQVSPGVIKYINSREGDKRFRVVDSLEELFAGDVFYFTCIATRTQLLKAFEEANALEGGRVLFQQEIYDKDEYWLEVMPQGATKANAVSRIKEQFGFDRLVVFGDGLNDMPLFEIADECYAMENAVPELKAIADGVIESNRDDGVAKWLNHVMEEGNFETK